MTNPCYRMPAEWEPQKAVLLAWPHADTDWVAYLREIQDVVVRLVEVITGYEDVIILTPDDEDVRAHLSSVLSAKRMKRVQIVTVPTDDTWVRDYGPITLVADIAGHHPSSADIKLLDFRFNAWGEKFAADKDNVINGLLYAHGCLSGQYEAHLDFVLEGGSIESDGKGTLFTTSSCLLAPHRNQPLTRRQLTLRLKTMLHAKRVVWLTHGQLMGDDTDGHIDTIVRCAPNDTLLYVSCNDRKDKHFADFQALERQLQRIKTPEGRPYRLLPLPMPEAMCYDCERLPATYANYLVINDAVICPTYGQPINDKIAMQVLSEAFPERNIIGVDASVIIRQHGSIHCMTMQLY